MISLILYGRNDSYGYNLHKRAAISLNCMAEVLDAPDDEILFVDYNTPDDFPTFPEAIQDTLTDRAKRLLRIFRVRPRHHERFRNRTHLLALEPIARNVALRRSNPANRWVLSTNTDMVFVSRHGRSLSDIAAELPDAYYPLPRFEVPETLWESANRLDPKGTIEAFASWGQAFHLNEIVFSEDPTVKYDAPGDFQLALRADLWKMHGFHESMLLGWHVDSNFAKRISLIPREPGDILDEVFGYHCDHTRQVTPAHRARAKENDLEVFVADVTAAGIPEQAETWGLAGEDIEEISVDGTSRAYLAALERSVPSGLAGATPSISYTYEFHNRIDYSVDHILPFLTDALASYPRDTILGWYGSKRSMLQRFAVAWKTMGFTTDIQVWEGATWLGSDLPAGCARAAEQSVSAGAQVLIFDWGRRDDVPMEAWAFATDPAVQGTFRGLRQAVRAERHRIESGSTDLRRFIGLNAVCNDAEPIFHGFIGAARTPIATRIRQGYVIDLLQQDLLPSLNAGGAARKFHGEIVSRPGAIGCVFFIPHLLLDSGQYRLMVEFSLAPNEDRHADDFTGVAILVTSNGCMLRDHVISVAEALAGSAMLDFTVPEGRDADDWPETEFTMRTLAFADVTVRRAFLTKLPDVQVPAGAESFDLLPMLTVGPAGTYAIDNDSGLALSSRPGITGFLAFGPHVWLMPGRYELSHTLLASAGAGERYVEAHIEVVHGFGKHLLAEEFVDFGQRGVVRKDLLRTGTLHFDIQDRPPEVSAGRLEVRIWSAGGTFRVTNLTLRRVGEPRPDERGIERLFGGRIEATREALARRVRLAYLEQLPAQNVLGLLHEGPAGRRAERAIEAVPDVRGIVAHGPYAWFLPGRYRVTLEFVVSQARRSAFARFEVVCNLGKHILAARDIALSAKRRRPVRHTAEFVIATDAPDPESGLLEFRVWSPGGVQFSVTSVEVRELAPDPRAQPLPLAGTGVDLVPTMMVGPGGRGSVFGIQAKPGAAGNVAHGPYMSLEAGNYEAVFAIRPPRRGTGGSLRLDVARDRGARILAEETITFGASPLARLGRLFGRERTATLAFEIADDASSADGTLEFRMFSSGDTAAVLAHVWVRRRVAR